MNENSIRRRGAYGGYIVIVNILILLAAASFFAHALIQPALFANGAAYSFLQSKHAFMLAHSAAA